MDVDSKLSMSLDELVMSDGQEGGEGGGRARGQKRRGPPEGRWTRRIGRTKPPRGGRKLVCSDA
jgi:hypothetical protein